LMPNAAAHRGKTLPGTSRAASPRKRGPTTTQAASHEDTSPDRLGASFACTTPTGEAPLRRTGAMPRLSASVT
jgi:hypothetical protein